MLNFEFFFMSFTKFFELKALWFEDEQKHWTLLTQKVTLTMMRNEAAVLLTHFYEFSDFLFKSNQNTHPMYMYLTEPDNQFSALALFYNFSRAREALNLPFFQAPNHMIFQSNFAQFVFTDRLRFSDLTVIERRNVRCLESAKNKEWSNFLIFFSNFEKRSSLITFVAILNFSEDEKIYEILKLCDSREISILQNFFHDDKEFLSRIYKIQAASFLEIKYFLNNHLYEFAMKAIKNASKSDDANETYNPLYSQSVSVQITDLLDYEFDDSD